MKIFASILLSVIFVGSAFSADLEVYKFDCKKTFKSSTYYECKVAVKNVSNKNIEHISVQIDSIDVKGNLVDSQNWGLGWSLGLILPGQQTINTVHVYVNPEIAYYKIQDISAWRGGEPKYNLTFKGKLKIMQKDIK